MGTSDYGSRMCRMLPGIEKQMAELNDGLLWSVAALAVACLLLVCLGVWYLFELTYIEKKAIKHKRWHRRRKHTIPWHKLKVVGPVMGCGSGGGGGGGGGKCPMGF